MTERMSDDQLARYEHDIRKGRWEDDGSLDDLLDEVRRAREENAALRARLGLDTEEENQLSRLIEANADLRAEVKRLRRKKHTESIRNLCDDLDDKDEEIAALRARVAELEERCRRLDGRTT